MKFIKLSLVAVLATNSAFAGGDIEPVVAPVVEEVMSNTTIAGKLTGYYYTDDSVDLFDKRSSQLGTAATLDVTHKFTKNIAMNFTAVGFANAMNDHDIGFFEGERSGAFMNVANITASFADTTVILGRQLLDTPMLGSFDWLLAPSGFEAYTVANSSIDNLTLVGSYVRTMRANNTGNDFVNLTDIGDGNNWTLGAAYDNNAINGSVWYYNVDAGDYTQVYVDAGYDFGVAKVDAQYVYTDKTNEEESNALGIKASATLGTFNLMTAYVNVADNTVGYVERDALYTSSWNTMTSNSIGDAFKVEAGTEFASVTASASYAYYEYDNGMGSEDGHEIDVILGYNITTAIDINAVYTNTDYGDCTGDINALEIYANYKF